MSKLLTPLLALALAGCGSMSSSSDQSGGSSAEPLRIAAWNIEHLAAGSGLGCEPRDEAGFALVTETIQQVDADVWLLQEIENEDALERVFGGDGWVFHVENRPDTGSKPECWGRDDGATLRMQRTAIVIREEIEHTRGADLEALDVGGRGFLRHGVFATIQHNGAFIDLMSIHLKSGCFSGDRSDDCPTLFQQVPVLEAWIDERSAQGRPVIVGGDFNRRLARGGDEVWADLNDGSPLNMSIAGEGTNPQCDPRYSEFIDFIVFNEAASEMVNATSFEEATFEEGFRASDHCAISIELN